MDKILVDTDIIIDYTHAKGSVLEQLVGAQNVGNLELFVSPIIIAEFFTDGRLTEPKRMKETKELFSIYNVVDVTAQTGFIAADLLRKKFIPLIGDALVAASCLQGRFQLATRNIKHFHKVPGLLLYTFS